jgi:hypothetical protein
VHLRGARPLVAAVLLLLGLLAPAERLAARLAAALALPLSALPLPWRAPASELSPEAREGDREAVAALVEAEANSLLPLDPSLRSRRFVYTGVTDREVGGGILRLDAGEEEGIRPGTPAVAGDALVGFVVDVAPRSSTVRSVRHPQFVVPGVYDTDPSETGGSRPRLVARGTGGARLAIELSERRDSLLGVAARCLGGGEGLEVPAEADGFRLGVVEEAPSGSGRDLRAFASPDLHSAVLLVVPGPGGLVVPERLALRRFTGRRVPMRVLRLPDLSPGRSSLLARVAGPHRVREGDALVVGERLVGVVEVAAFGCARVRLLDDPAARIEGILASPGGVPVPLGPMRPQDGLYRIGRDLGSLSGILHAGPIGTHLPRGLVLGPAQLRGDRVRLERGFDPYGLGETEALGGEGG